MWGSRHLEIDRVIFRNLCIQLKGYTDCEELGLASREDGILGVSLLTIPAKYVYPFLSYCGDEMSEDDRPRGYGDFETYNSDIIIKFFQWALTQRRRMVSVEMELNHFYWLFHDLYHATHHVSSCFLNVGPNSEFETYTATFDLAKEAGPEYYELCLLTEDESRELVDAFNTRFASRCDKMPYYIFDPYLKKEELEIED